MEKLDLGNNEAIYTGVYRNDDGTYLAITFSKSKTFKTEKGAIAWYKRNTAE